MADGSIVISSKLDNKKAEKELDRLIKKIESMEAKLSAKESERNQIAEQLKAANEEAIEAYKNVERLQSELKASQAVTSVSGPSTNPLLYMQELENQRYIKEELLQQEKVLKQKETAAERLAAKDAKAVKELERQTAELNRQKAAAAEVADQIKRTNALSGALSDTMSGVTNRIDNLGKRIAGLAKRALVFSLITSALRGVRTWMGKVVKVNSEATSAIALLKGALLTMAQPLVEVVIPAFVTLVNILTRVISTLAQLFAMLTGKSIQSAKEAAKALNKETEALEETGAAADKAAGSLAGFDEINTINTETAGGASSTDSIVPDFDFESNLSEDRLKNILSLIEAIGSAFLAWRIGEALGLGLKGIVGLALAIYSAIQFVKNMFDAWTDGVNWDNLLGMLLSAAGIAAGLYLAFGKVGAGIGLVVSGLAMLITGFHDAMQNGWSLENLLTTIAGILTTGLGIGILTGSWIPLLIAAIASVVLAITTATGHGEELINGVKLILQGFKDFFSGVFTGDIEKAAEGISSIFAGIEETVNSVISGVKDLFLGFFDWLDKKTNGKLHKITEFMKGLFTAVFDTASTALGGLMDAATTILQGVLNFLVGVFTGDWDKAWEGVKSIFKGVWNGIVSTLEAAVNLIIQGINWLIKQLNKVSFSIPDWVPAIGGKKFGFNIPSVSEISIPRLATGAVIPPNREFLAVLGDQKSGTNIETPLATMVDAFKQAWAEVGGGNNGTVTVVVELDGREVARNTVRHVNDMTRERGKPVILV